MKHCLIANLADTSLAAGILPEGKRCATVPMIALNPLLARQVVCKDRFATLPMNTPYAEQGERVDRFATEPAMGAVNEARARQMAYEEELHTSFEEAISGRAARVGQQLSRLPLATASRELPTTGALLLDAPSRRLSLRHFWREQRRAIILIFLGLGLLLAGFDLMGLLVLVR